MNTILQLEVWQLAVICGVCLAAGFCFAVVFMSRARSNTDRVKGEGWNGPPTTPRPDVIVKPQASKPKGSGDG